MCRIVFAAGGAVFRMFICAVALLGFAGAVVAADIDRSQAEPFRLTGMVVNKDGVPMPGVAVSVKGTTRGEITGLDGKFSISVTRDEILEFSMLGYKSTEVLVGSRTDITVAMEENVSKIDEVVVIGYGESTAADVTGTISVIDSEKLNNAPTLSLDQALQGKAAGVRITSNDGQPGSSMNIVIRGANSLTQSNAPLYVIDGFPTDDFSSMAVDPADVASISILKDASATAIYGARGANGVVIIETHSGKIGKTKVSYSGNVGVQQISKMLDVMSPYDYVKYMIELSPESAPTYLEKQGMTLEDYRNVEPIDWQKMLFRPAVIHSHNVSVSGGTKSTKYLASASYSSQDGIIINSGYERAQVRFRLEQAIGKRVKLDVNTNYSWDHTHGAVASEEASSSNAYASYLMFRVWSYRPIALDGQTVDDILDDFSSLSSLNPITSTRNESNRWYRKSFNINARVSWRITDDLTLNVRGIFNDRNRINKVFNNRYTYSGFPTINNSNGVNGRYTDIGVTQLLNENTLNYKKTIKRDHTITAMAGFTIMHVGNNNYGYVVKHIPYEEMGYSGIDTGIPSNVTSSETAYRLMSVLARFNYSYKSRYLFTASFRADGSSKFAPGHRWGFFPSAAFAWRINNEPFMKSVRWIDNAKLRISWGQTGNNRIGSYASYGVITFPDYYSFDNAVPEKGVDVSTLNNPYLTWETTMQTDLGLDLSVLDSRINLTLDLYRKTTDDLLLNAKVVGYTGFTQAMRNVGKIRNEGLEISLNTVNVRTRDFEWSTDFNISFNRSKTLRLSDGQNYLLSYIGGFLGEYNSTPLYITRVGGPITAFYGVVWDGVYQLSDFDVNPDGTYTLKSSVPTNGSARNTIQPGDIKYVDQNKDGVINDADRVVIGRALPIHTGGFGNTFRYRNFSFNIFFTWSYGNKIMNANRIMLEGNAVGYAINQYASYADRWSLDNQDSENFRTRGQGPRGIFSSRTLEDGSFLRLQSMQLSYSVPKKILRNWHMEALTVGLSAQNLWTWSKYSGLDPEVSTKHTTLTPGFDYSSYARNRIYSLSVQITF